MKSTLCATALFVMFASAASAQSGCFTMDPIQVLSSPGSPLIGNGSYQNGTISGNFNGVTWDDDSNLSSSLAGGFSIDIVWNAPIDDAIEWTTVGNAIQFNTTNQDSFLAFGNLDVKLDDPNCKVEKVNFTVSVCLNEKGISQANQALDGAGKDAELYVLTKEGTAYATKFDGRDGASSGLNLSELKLLTEYKDEKGSSYLGSSPLSYAISTDGGKTFIRTEDPINFDTHLTMGACVSCVPEPSTASLGILALGALVIRRKR